MLLTVIMAFAGAQTAGADTGNPGDGVDYVDADGVVKNTATDGIDGNDSPTVITEGSSSSYYIVNLSPGWYVVTGSNVEFKGSLKCSGAMHLILADGAKMTINCDKPGSNGMDISNGGLTIYGQSLGTGELYVPSSTRNGIYVNGGDIIINGGKVSATTTYANASGIYTFEHAIINDGTVTAVGTQCGIYGSKAVTINGGKVSATYTDGSSSGYGIFTESHQTITLGFRHEDDQIYVDKYRPNNVIVKVKDGQTLCDNDNAGNRYSGTISDVSAINGKTLTPVRTVAYIDGDGVTQQAEDFTMLTGSSANTLLPAGWYVVSGSDVNYSGRLESTSGDLHIILADGAKLTVGNALLCTGNLTIYGQSGGTGQLVATAPAGHTPIQTSSGLTINGGHFSASTTYNQYAILAGANGVTINGGIVSATATYSNCYGIATEGAITLGWRTASDRITASSYYAMGGVSVKAGQAFMNSDAAPAYLSGTISDMALIDGKTLRPINPADFELTATNEYTIKTADGWGVFCDLLSDYAKGIFTGKTVKLAADITVSRMAGSSDKPFTGTFNGQGKTLTVSYSGSSYVAPFSYVDGATIQNLVVEGTIISSSTRAAGVIGETGSPGTTGKSYITNCVSSSTITGGNYSGGFSIGGNVEIEGCVFNGIINSDGNSGGFVGYSQSALTITNSLFAPQSGSSAKGTFYYNGTAGTLTNCYYTQTLGEGQGKQAHSIAAGEGVTLGHDGAATEYSVSGITAYKASDASGDSDPFIAGIIYNNVLYAGSGDAVSLTLANTAPLGYQYSGYTASGGTLSGNDTDGWTLTMPDEDVTISATFTQIPVSYLDENGEEQQCTNYTALTGNETQLLAGWYVADGTIDFDQQISTVGDVHIILKDGAVMNVGTENNPIQGFGIGDENASSISIYGQSTGTNNGQLNVYATDAGILTNYGDFNCSSAKVTASSSDESGIFAYHDNNNNIGNITLKDATVNATGTYGLHANATLTINGGKVTATGTASDGISDGIYVEHGSVNINGGEVTVTATSSNDYCIGIQAIYGSVNISGGQVTATGNGAVGYGILAASVDIRGGQVTATGNGTGYGCYGIKAANGALLGWTNPTDYILANSYSGGFTLTKAFIDEEGNTYVNHETYASDIGGKTLRPFKAITLADNADNSSAISEWNGGVAHVTLSGRTLSKSGEWNTLCLPFDVEDGDTSDELSFTGTPLEGATVKELNAATSNLDNGTLTLNFTPANSIEAGKPYIVRWGTPEDNPGGTIVDPVFEGVTISSTAPTAVTFTGGSFVGQYSPFSITADNIDEIILLSTGNRLGYSKSARTLRSFRAHFEIPTSGGVREFVLNFDEENTTGIISPAEIKEITDCNATLSKREMAGAWYSLDGRKLDTKPTAKGVYIRGGKKVIIK